MNIQIKTKRVNKETILIGIILLIAIAVRLWGIKFGLPYIYHPDEPRYLINAQLLFKTLNLNPLSLPDISSSKFVYVINALAYLPYYLIGKLTGMFNTPMDIPAPQMLAMGVGITSKPTTFLLGRFVTVLFGTANVGLVFLIGKKLFKNAMIGLLAALIMALSPTNVSLSQFITPDTFVVFFVLLAFLGTVCMSQHDKPIVYILSGLALGCVLSTKVSGILIALPLLVVYFYRKGKKGLLDLNLYLMVITGTLAFVVTTPYIFGDVGKVVEDILSEGRHYSQGHAGMEGNSLQWYLTYMWQTSGVIYILASFEVLHGLYLRSKRIILLSIFPVVYFIFICSFTVRNDRTLLPLMPFLFLLAASFLTYLLNKAAGLKPKVWRTALISAIVCLAFAAMVLPTSNTIANAIKITRIDSRETARIWITDNLPSGAKIGIESYSPFVEPARFSVQGFGRMIDNKPEWYIENGFEYLVFSQGMYGRFYNEPERYSAEVSQYDAFFNRFLLIKMFNDGDYEIRIYKVE